MRRIVDGAFQAAIEHSAAVAVFGMSPLLPSAGHSMHGQVCWREKDWSAWWHSHQMYQRAPEQLCEAELSDVQDWCRCLKLVAKLQQTEYQEWPVKEREFVAETLERLCPDLPNHAGFFPIYQACRGLPGHILSVATDHVPTDPDRLISR